jgi:hypothetical protein
VSSLRIATFHSFKLGLKPGEKCTITVDWQKELCELGNGCRGPGYVVREVVCSSSMLVPVGTMTVPVLGVFYGPFADADAIRCAIKQYRERKKEYCEFHRIPWGLLPSGD